MDEKAAEASALPITLNMNYHASKVCKKGDVLLAPFVALDFMLLLTELQVLSTEHIPLVFSYKSSISKAV